MHISVNPTTVKIITVIVVILVVFAITTALVTMSISLVDCPDWEINFRPAAQKLLRFQSPYDIEGFYNPPWTLLPLLPFAVLPIEVGKYLIAYITLVSYGYVAYRMGARPVTLALILTSPPSLMAVNNINIEWLVVLGFILPPQIGLFFILMKPQIGAGLALLWFIQAYRKGKLREVARVFGPVTVAFLISFMVFGLYPLKSISFATGFDSIDWNMSGWPVSLIFGIPMLVYALRTQKQNLTIAVSPLLSPYVAGYTWLMVPFGLLPYKWESCAAALVMWIVWLL